jgi:hypothetical protein
MMLYDASLSLLFLAVPLCCDTTHNNDDAKQVPECMKQPNTATTPTPGKELRRLEA